MRYAAAALVLILAVTGLLFAWRGYTTHLDAQGYARGVAETTAAYVKRDNAQLQAALTALHAAEVRARTVEDEQAAALARAKAAYTKGIEDERKALARMRAGTLVLRDPGRQTGPGATLGSGITASTPGPARCGDDGAARAGLSAEGAEFLVSEAGRADTVVRQLTLCQARVVSDLAACASP